MPITLDFSGKLVVVTGGGRGIGAAISKALAKGASPVLRAQEPLALKWTCFRRRRCRNHIHIGRRFGVRGTAVKGVRRQRQGVQVRGDRLVVCQRDVAPGRTGFRAEGGYWDRQRGGVVVEGHP
jgi:NAD(P)-dependent dehydrogenase (short-subunit alcohol dehydrogenase family)